MDLIVEKDLAENEDKRDKFLETLKLDEDDLNGEIQAYLEKEFPEGVKFIDELPSEGHTMAWCLIGMTITRSFLKGFALGQQHHV